MSSQYRLCSRCLCCSIELSQWTASQNNIVQLPQTHSYYAHFSLAVLILSLLAPYLFIMFHCSLSNCMGAWGGGIGTAVFASPHIPPTYAGVLLLMLTASVKYLFSLREWTTPAIHSILSADLPLRILSQNAQSLCMCY